MSSDILNKKVGDSPEPRTYSAGAVVQFAVQNYNINTFDGGFIAEIRLRPDEVVSWPEDEDEPEVSELPITRHPFFFMDNQPSALREFAKSMEQYVGIPFDEDQSLGELLQELRGSAVTFFVKEGPDDRGNYKFYLRHNTD